MNAIWPVFHITGKTYNAKPREVEFDDIGKGHGVSNGTCVSRESEAMHTPSPATTKTIDIED